MRGQAEHKLQRRAVHVVMISWCTVRCHQTTDSIQRLDHRLQTTQVRQGPCTAAGSASADSVGYYIRYMFCLPPQQRSARDALYTFSPVQDAYMHRANDTNAAHMHSEGRWRCGCSCSEFEYPRPEGSEGPQGTNFKMRLKRPNTPRSHTVTRTWLSSLRLCVARACTLQLLDAL